MSEFTTIRDEQRFWLWGTLALATMALEVLIVAWTPVADGGSISWGMKVGSVVAIVMAAYYAGKVEGYF